MRESEKRRRLRVLLIEDDTLVGMGLRGQLERLGHEVIGQAATHAQADALYRTGQPDLALVDIRLGGHDGIEVARSLLAQRPCAMIIVSAFSDEDLVRRAGEAGVYGYLIKPASLESLRAQIEVVLKRFAENEALRAEKEKLAQTLEVRKLTERAKGILMKRANLSEEDAHRRLQQESQKRRISLADLARKIIESEELISGG